MDCVDVMLLKKGLSKSESIQCSMISVRVERDDTRAACIFLPPADKEVLISVDFDSHVVKIVGFCSFT